MDDVFKALADPSRRQLLDSLQVRPGQNLRDLCAGLNMARQSVSKHLAILEEANLIVTVRQGREKLHFLNAAPINDIARRWISQYDQTRIDALTDLKLALENPLVTGPTFTYATYIKTTATELFEALTVPAFTERYWGFVLESDWRPGSTITLHDRGVVVADPAQIVLEYEPPRRLAYTWFTFTPEWSKVQGLNEAEGESRAAEPRSKVTFTIEDLGPMVKLTVVHDGFEPGSQVIQSISGGWPKVLSALKTLLETGEPLPGPTYAK